MTEADDAQPSTLCPVCRLAIPRGARKCTHCDSYLGRWRFLNISQTTLALLIALISLISTTAPGFIDLLTPDYSKLHAETRQVYRQNLELFITNQGNQVGRLVSVSIGATTEAGRSLGPMGLEVAHDGQIPPKAATKVFLTVHPENVDRFLSWPFAEIRSCALHVRLAEYRETPKPVVVDCPLELLSLFCKGTEGAARAARRLDADESHCADPPGAVQPRG